MASREPPTRAGAPSPSARNVAESGAHVVEQRLVAKESPLPPRPRQVSDGPLPAETRAALEDSLGHDFSAVRVHSGPDAKASAVALGASAFNVGPHIVMGDDPSLTDPRGYASALVHEATHVAQRGL